MGFSESDSTKCRRHPNPKQLPGVCPNCLRERLSNLSTTTTTTCSSKTTTCSALSNSSSLFSASTTTVSHHRRNGSEVPAYVSVGMVLNSTGLKKSRSVSCAALSCKSIREKSMDANKNIINNKNCIMKNDYNYKNEEGDHQEKEGECKLRKKIGGGGFLKKLIHKKTRGV